MLRRQKTSVNKKTNRYEQKYIDIIRRLETAASTNYNFSSSSLRRSLLTKLEGTDPLEGLEICRHLHETLHLGGDVCEFGVAQGRTSALIAEEIRATGSSATLHLYDSFEGLPAPTEEDELVNDIFQLGSIEAYAGSMSLPMSEVISRMSEISFQNYKIWAGFINENTFIPNAISFAYLDMDFFMPTLVGLRLVWPSLLREGVVLVDDYGFFSSGAKRAVDDFVSWTEDAEFSDSPPGAGPFAVIRKA